MTIEEIVAELEAATKELQSPDGYYTTDELATAYGVSDTKIRKKLHLLQRANRLDIAPIWRPNLVGVMQKRPGYRILPA